jgi:hypothetical protein
MSAPFLFARADCAPSRAKPASIRGGIPVVTEPLPLNTYPGPCSSGNGELVAVPPDGPFFSCTETPLISNTGRDLLTMDCSGSASSRTIAELSTLGRRQDRQPHPMSKFIEGRKSTPTADPATIRSRPAISTSESRVKVAARDCSQSWVLVWGVLDFELADVRFGCKQPRDRTASAPRGAVWKIVSHPPWSSNHRQGVMEGIPRSAFPIIFTANRAFRRTARPCPRRWYRHFCTHSSSLSSMNFFVQFASSVNRYQHFPNLNEPKKPSEGSCGGKCSPTQSCPEICGPSSQPACRLNLHTCYTSTSTNQISS